jgi:hypothetical protein
MPPQLLKRLAEAALGPFRDKEQFWVCRFEPDNKTHSYDIDGPFTKEQAEDKLKEVTATVGKGFGVFGPYQRAPGDPVRIFLQDPPAEILEIKIKVKIKENDKEIMKELDINPKDFDALFWGPPAVEKFVLPYYAAVSGLDYAIKVRTDYLEGKAYLMAHSGDTEGKIFKPEELKEVKTGGDKLNLLPL